MTKHTEKMYVISRSQRSETKKKISVKIISTNKVNEVGGAHDAVFVGLFYRSGATFKF